MKPRWNRALMCYVIDIQADTKQHIARVSLPEHSAPDMSGTIRTVAKTDPLVEEIQVWVNGKPDTAYVKDDSGEWACRRYKQPDPTEETRP